MGVIYLFFFFSEVVPVYRKVIDVYSIQTLTAGKQRAIPICVYLTLPLY